MCENHVGFTMLPLAECVDEKPLLLLLRGTLRLIRSREGLLGQATTWRLSLPCRCRCSVCFDRLDGPKRTRCSMLPVLSPGNVRTLVAKQKARARPDGEGHSLPTGTIRSLTLPFKGIDGDQARLSGCHRPLTVLAFSDGAEAGRHAKQKQVETMSERTAVRKLRDHQGPFQGPSKGPARDEMPSGSCRAAELQRDDQ